MRGHDRHTRSGLLTYSLAVLRAVGVPIYASTNDEVVFRQQLLPWGVEPFLMPWQVVITNALAHDEVIDTLPAAAGEGAGSS